MKVQLSSIVKPVQKTTSSTGENTVTTYYRGDPEFDTYEQENIAFREKMRLRVEHENGLPKNFLGVSSKGTTLSRTQLGTKLADAFSNFYLGEIDITALESTFSDIVADLRISYINKGYDEKDFMIQLIEDAYTVSRLYNIRGTGEASWHDGLPFAAEHNGHSENTADWIYYDADYYYQSEEMKGTLQEFAKDQAVKYGIDPSKLNLPTEYPDGDIRKSIYSSYTTFRNSRARDVGCFGNIIDETIPPPKGLRFFYKANESGTDKLVPKLPAPQDEMESLFDGVLRVWYGDWSFIGRVPVRQDPNKFPISVNMFDVVSKGSKSPIPDEITDFLHNVDFFTFMMSEAYKKDHPRQI